MCRVILAMLGWEVGGQSLFGIVLKFKTLIKQNQLFQCFMLRIRGGREGGVKPNSKIVRIALHIDFYGRSLTDSTKRPSFQNMLSKVAE